MSCGSCVGLWNSDRATDAQPVKWAACRIKVSSVLAMGFRGPAHPVGIQSKLPHTWNVRQCAVLNSPAGCRQVGVDRSKACPGIHQGQAAVPRCVNSNLHSCCYCCCAIAVATATQVARYPGQAGLAGPMGRWLHFNQPLCAHNRHHGTLPETCCRSDCVLARTVDLHDAGCNYISFLF